jgi:hypothetical protein
MISTLHVLSIGSPNAATIARDVLVLRARCRWPCAKILLIQDTNKNSDSSMYDEQLNPDAKATVFLAAIERLAALSRRAKRPLAITRSAQNTRAEDVSAA